STKPVQGDMSEVGGPQPADHVEDFTGTARIASGDAPIPGRGIEEKCNETTATRVGVERLRQAVAGRLLAIGNPVDLGRVVVDLLAELPERQLPAKLLQLAPELFVPHPRSLPQHSLLPTGQQQQSPRRRTPPYPRTLERPETRRRSRRP